MNLFRAVCLALCALGSAGALAQATYPAKAVRLVVPYPPGGSNDVLTRITAQAMTPGLGQPVVVDNRFIANEITRWRKVALEAGIKPE